MKLITSERGLTLVEIIVVLIILALVMTFLGGRIFGAGDKAKASLTKIMIKDIGQAIETYRLEYNSLPANLNELTACGEKNPGCTPPISEEKTKDAWGNAFQYSLENGGRSYKISSLGADGQAGGDGVNYDIFGTGP